MNGAVCAPRNYSKTCFGPLPLTPRANFKRTHSVSKTQQELPEHQYSSDPIHHNCPPVLCRAHTRTGPSILCPSMLLLCREKCCTQNTCRNSAGTQPHAESRDWLTVELTEGLPKPFAATHLSLSADAEEQAGTRGNWEPDFEFPLFFRLSFSKLLSVERNTPLIMY